MSNTRRLAAIMFTDIAGYTALMQRSEADAIHIRQRHRDVFEPTTKRFGGKIIQYYGDGTLSIFDSSVDALYCAAELQRQFREEPAIPIRIGLHTGEIVLTKDDIVGDSVNLASRVESLGVPGSVLLSGKVAEEVRNQEDLHLVGLGSFHFRHDSHSREIFALNLPGLVVPKPKDLSGKLEHGPPGSRIPDYAKVLLGVLVLAVILLAIWIIQDPQDHQEIDRLAVLPFFNRTNDPEQANVVDGLHEAVIAELQQAGIVVKARQSMLRYRQTELPPEDIAHELKVQALIEGSVIRVDDSLALVLSLIDGNTGDVIWNGPFQADFSQVFDLYSRITQQVAEEIHQALSPETVARLESKRQVDPEAYKAYLQGQQHWYSLTRASLNTAMKYFQLSAEIDSTYALAYAGMAAVWIGRKTQGFVSEEASFPPLQAAIQKALSLGADQQEVQFWYALHSWLRWDWEEAERSFQRALALNPNYAEAHAYYGHMMLQRGQSESEAMLHLEKAVELDPFNPLLQALYGMGLNFTRQYDKVIDQLNETLRSAPTDPVALSTLRTSYHLVGDYEKAIETWIRFHESRDDREAVATMEEGFQEGGYALALTRMAELLIERSGSSYIPPWQIATLYTRAGTDELALDWLERALPTHDPSFAYIACDPIFDPLREDPRFMQLLVRIGLDH